MILRSKKGLRNRRIRMMTARHGSAGLTVALDGAPKFSFSRLTNVFQMLVSSLLMLLSGEFVLKKSMQALILSA